MNEIVDVMPFQYQIVESESGRFRVEGIFQRSDVENANKRVYPRGIWEKELKEKRVIESLDNRAMFGELDHPSDGKTSLKRASHIITNLELGEDGVVTGGAEVLGTPNGKILRTLFESGVQVGISSRGSGSVQNGRVQEDFKLGTFDFVARPSTPGATPRHKSGASEGTRTRTEDTEGKDVLVTAVGDEVDDALLNQLYKELGDLDLSLTESADAEDFNEVAERVISLHNAVCEAESFPADFVDEAHEEVLNLSGVLAAMALENPQHEAVLAELQTKVNDSRSALIEQDPNKNSKEETMDEKLQFILDRIQEANARAEADTDDTELSEAEALYQELDELSDEDLVDVALEVGALDPDDLEVEEGEDDDEIDADDIDVQALYDFAVDTENELVEAQGIIEQLVQHVEESGDYEDVVLKYETSLGIIQETALHYQLLQEAVGGEEKATELVEAHIQKLEAAEANDEEEAGNVNEDIDNDDAEVIEKILEDDSVENDRVGASVALFESAKSRFGALN